MTTPGTFFQSIVRMHGSAQKRTSRSDGFMIKYGASGQKSFLAFFPLFHETGHETASILMRLVKDTLRIVMMMHG